MIARTLIVALAFACGTKDSAAPKIVPSLHIVAGNNQVDTVGKTLPIKIGAALTDNATGAPLSGRIVNWSVVNGGGALFVDVTQTGSDGVTRNTYTLGTIAGTQRMVARYIDPDTGDPITLDTAFATALAGPPVVIWANNQPFPTPAPQGWTGTVQVVGRGGSTSMYFGFTDNYGNQSAGCPDLVTWTYSGNADFFALDTIRIVGTPVEVANLTWRQDFVIDGAGQTDLDFFFQASCAMLNFPRAPTGIPVYYRP